MKKKNLIFYAVIAILIAIVMWQWLSASTNSTQMYNLDVYNNQLQVLLGIGSLNSAHQHADVKVYLKDKAVDFSLPKYQLTTNYLHFEEGVGDVIHTHASGITIGHMVRAVGGTFSSECLVFEGKTYCNDNENLLKFYVNGKKNSEYDNYIINDTDKILISYGPKNENIQQQLISITDLARVYSKK